MHDAETRALMRATVLLIVVSLARWGWTRVQHTARPDDQAPSVLDHLAASVDSAVDEADRRSRPLADGERIDPNRADEVELDRLPGVGPAVAAAIVSARGEGMTFRRADDLEGVRGVGPALVARLTPLLDLTDPPAPGRASRSGDATIDVNRAGASELQALPGIGPALADRIVQHRREHLFTRVEDLLDVPGIGPRTLDRLRPRVTVRRDP